MGVQHRFAIDSTFFFILGRMVNFLRGRLDYFPSGSLLLPSNIIITSNSELAFKFITLGDCFFFRAIEISRIIIIFFILTCLNA